MLKFWYSKYELYPMNAFGAIADENVRKGALLKVSWPNGNTGYGDIFPWPELKDPDIDTHLEALEKGKMSQLIEQTIWLAKKDAALRKANKSAFAGAAKIKNHYLITDYTKFNDISMRELRASGFTTLKIKVGRDLDDEVKFVSRMLKQNPVNIRLDFNSKTQFNDYEKFMAQLSLAEKPRIEYAEDPMPWHPDAWVEAALIGVPLAIDFEYENINWEKVKTPLPFKIVVIKPARQDVDKAVKIVDKYGLRMVVTSALDHPVGVAHASYIASELKRFYPNTLLDCGCLTLRSYKPNDFTSRVTVQGPYLTSISGTGIGFDELFARTTWEPIKKEYNE